MKIKQGDKFKVINKDVLQGYYDSKYDNNTGVLTVTDIKLPKVVNRSGGSSYFAIFAAINKKTNIGHELRFSVSLDKITKLNFIRVK